MTLGELLMRVEGSEMAYATNMRTVEREEGRSPISAIHTRACAEALRFRPDESAMPGISRLETFADKEWGSGLTPESCRRMRGLICLKATLTLDAANALSLTQAADILFGLPSAPLPCTRIAPRERVRAYLADVRAVENGWETQGGGLKSFVIGSSPWDSRGQQLDEIKSRHGFRPDHPLIRSITAFQIEAKEIHDERKAAREATGWPIPTDHPEFQASWQREMVFDFRMGNCRGRHFPRLDADGSNVRTAADLWADINGRLLAVRLMLEPGPRGRPPLCPQDVEQVYGVMHRLNIPGVPAPPYPAFTSAEAEHELQRIASELERDDRIRYDRAMIEEEGNVWRDADVVPTLADLVAYHRAWEDDPETGGSGLVTIRTTSPTSDSPTLARLRADRLSPAARSLGNADIRYQVEDLASQRGFCEVGDFTSRTAEGLKSRLIGSRGISAAEADATPLTDVLAFLRLLPAASAPEFSESNRWLTVTEAATVAVVDRWAITRAADNGQLITNGKKRTERRIDKISLVDWLLRRSKEPEPQESDAQVRAAMRRADDD